MISLTRLSGSPFVLNADLIERIDRTPDTVVTLTDGSKYMVVESLDEVVGAVRRHRAEIIALSTWIQVVPDDADDPVPADTSDRPVVTLASVTPHPAYAADARGER